MSKIKIEIVNILEAGTCNFGHKVGDIFVYPDDKGKLCSYAWHSLFPYLTSLQNGASFPWEDDPDSITLCCPDYKNPVVFNLTRVEE